MRFSFSFPRGSWFVVSVVVLSVSPLFASDYDHAASLYSQKSYTAAFREFLALAQNGDMDAQQAVGLMYERGRGVKQDYAKAALWYERSARQGHEIAAGNLGVQYRDGHGVRQNYTTALKWLKRGAMGDAPYAMYNLGAMYANGQGTPADPVEGWAWVSMAVEEDVPGASDDLGRIAKLLSPSDLKRAEARVDDLWDRIDNDEEDTGYRPPVDPAQAPASNHSSQAAKAHAPAAFTGGWQSSNADGFSLRHPDDWTVSRNRQGTIAVRGTHGESLVIWPMYSQQRMSDAFADQLLASITRKLEPHADLGRASTIAPGEARAYGNWNGREFVTSLVWTGSSRGSAATYVMASAPQGRFDLLVSTFAQIMQSLSLKGSATASSGGGASKLAYAGFTDPTEGAFTVEVPVGWEAQGGVATFNASDVRPWLRLQSRDGRTRVFLGDPQTPSMLVPNQALTFSGSPEGSIYDAGYNQRFLVRSYYPGKQAARLWAMENLSNLCGDAVVEDFRDRPELSAAINRIFLRYGSPFAQQELHTGEISLSCPGTGRAEYVFAGTLLTQIPTGMGVFGMWVLNYLYGFDAPRENAATALEVTQHLAGSFRVTSQWARMNTGTQGDVSGIIAETGAAISKSVSDGFWNAQRSREKWMNKNEQAILGVEETLDPVTGEKIEIVSGSNYAWIDHRGNVVGTQTDTVPSIDYRRLLKINK